MIAPEHAARIAGVSTREIYAWVEAGKLHFAESADRSPLICLESLSASITYADNTASPPNHWGRKP
jgi:hypothetical protein